MTPARSILNGKAVFGHNKFSRSAAAFADGADHLAIDFQFQRKDIVAGQFNLGAVVQLRAVDKMNLIDEHVDKLVQWDVLAFQENHLISPDESPGEVQRQGEAAVG